MTYSLHLAEIAKQEIAEAFLWYSGKREKLGYQFEAHITKLIESIQNNPGIFQVRYRDVRIAFMKKFPFGIHYRVIESKITIIGVYHTSRDPKNWDR